MDVTIRAARTAELALVLSMWVQAGIEPTHTDDEVSLRALLAHDPGALSVAVVGDVIVGSVIAAWDGWRGTIYRLVVAPSHRRQRLARRLLELAEGRLADKGASRLQATVVTTDVPATAFWRASDWELQRASGCAS